MPIIILEPQQRRVAIAVSPKVACVSLRMWLWHLGHGRAWDGPCIFQEFAQHTMRPNQALPPEVQLVIAVHRDGVSRLRAVYDHRVVKEREAPDRGIQHFARHLPEYVAMFPSIAHHVAAQSSYLGSVKESFTDIVPLSKLALLRDAVKDALGENIPDLPVHHRTEKPSQIDEDVSYWFSQWTSHDTALGWDGKTLRIAGEDIEE